MVEVDEGLQFSTSRKDGLGRTDGTAAKSSESESESGSVLSFFSSRIHLFSS